MSQIAAKQALRRKKVAESTLETTLGQITTLEQQINAIESANINRETLAAMQAAREAMGKIHGKLTPEKVDEEMLVLTYPTSDLLPNIVSILTNTVGRNSKKRTISAMKSPQPLPAPALDNRLTRGSSRTSLKSSSRRRWTRSYTKQVDRSLSMIRSLFRQPEPAHVSIPVSYA